MPRLRGSQRAEAKVPDHEVGGRGEGRRPPALAREIDADLERRVDEPSPSPIHAPPQVLQLRAIQALADRQAPAAPVGRPPPAGTGLPEPLRAGIERLSGVGVGDVRVHHDSPRPADVDAHAYTRGADIFVGPGQARHLPHEAWHVVQQRQGRVTPTLQLATPAGRSTGARAINDDPHLEREADVMGARAAAEAPSIADAAAPSSAPPIEAGRDPAPVLQRAPDDKKWKGKAGKQPKWWVDAGKPSGVVAGAVGTGELVANVSKFTELKSQQTVIDPANPDIQKTFDAGIDLEFAGALVDIAATADQVNGLFAARSEREEAQRFGDQGAEAVASDKIRTKGATAARALTTRLPATGLKFAGLAAGDLAATTPTMMAAGGLGIAGGGILASQGLWRGGKAAIKLSHLRGATLLTDEGAAWRAHINKVQQYKVGINALKVAAGALGIAAASLLLAGLAVGTAGIGIAAVAAAVGIGIAVGKTVAKVQNSRDANRAASALKHQEAAAATPRNTLLSAVFAADPELQADFEAAERGGEFATERSQEPPQGEGFRAAPRGWDFEASDPEVQELAREAEERHREWVLENGGPDDHELEQRQAALELAHRIALLASENARVAAQMIEAMNHGDRDRVLAAIDAGDPTSLHEPDDLRLHDACVLLDIMHISAEEALSASGLERIVAKLSKAEAT